MISRCGFLRATPHGGLDQVQHRLEVVGVSAHRQVQHQPVVGQLEELGQHRQRYVGAQSTPASRWRASRSRVAAETASSRACQRSANSGSVRMRRDTSSWLPGAAGVSGEVACPAGRASLGRGRCGRRSPPSPRRHLRPPRGTAIPCHGSGERSPRGTARWPPPAAGLLLPHTRGGQSRCAPRRESLAVAHPVGLGSPSARFDRGRLRPTMQSVRTACISPWSRVEQDRADAAKEGEREQAAEDADRNAHAVVLLRGRAERAAGEGP